MNGNYELAEGLICRLFVFGTRYEVPRIAIPETARVMRRALSTGLRTSPACLSAGGPGCEGFKVAA